MVYMAQRASANEKDKGYIAMSKLLEQEEQIERMRSQLHQLVIAKSCNMIDHEVSELSKKLDTLIVKYQKTQAQEKVALGR